MSRFVSFLLIALFLFSFILLFLLCARYVYFLRISYSNCNASFYAWFCKVQLNIKCQIAHLLLKMTWKCQNMFNLCKFFIQSTTRRKIYFSRPETQHDHLLWIEPGVLYLESNTKFSIRTGPWFVYKCEVNVCFYPQYSDYEKVVIEDRVAKEQARRKAEQELEELKAATKVSFEKRFY